MLHCFQKGGTGSLRLCVQELGHEFEEVHRFDDTCIELYKHSVCSREVPVDPLPEEAWRCLLEPMPEVRKHPTTKSTCTLLVYPAIGCGA